MISDTAPASAAGSQRQRARWINVFLGNPLNGERRTAPRRLQALAHHLDRLAAFHDRDLLIAGGPRTRPELYDILGSALLSYHQIYRWRPEDPANPFELMVKGAADSIVTGDSIAMISQLVAAGHRVLIFPWHRPRGLLGGLLEKARTMPPERPRKDTAAFRASLVQRQLAAELDDDADFRMVTPQVGLQDELFVRLRTFLR